MSNASKIKVIALTVVLAIIILLLMWSNGLFNIVDRQTSPNGDITLTVYNRDISGIFPQNIGFSVKATGAREGTHIYTGNHEFDGLWWSPDSKHVILSYLYEGERLLELESYERNSASNLSIYINMSMSSTEQFTSIMDENSWDSLEFKFVEWLTADGDMHVEFSFIDINRNTKQGTLDYNHKTGALSNITFES